MLDGPVSGVVHGRTADLLIVVFVPDTDDRARRPAETTTSHGAEAGTPGLSRPAETGGRAIAVVAADAPGISVTEGTDLIGAPVDDLVFTATPVEFHGESRSAVRNCGSAARRPAAWHWSVRPAPCATRRCATRPNAPSSGDR